MNFGELGKDEMMRVLTSEGLSKNEIKAYLTLLRHRKLAELEVAKKSTGIIDQRGIPQAKVYGVLKSLSQKGFALRTLDRKYYYPKDPAVLFEKRVGQIMKLKEALKEIYQTSEEAEAIQDAIIEEVSDEDKLLTKILEIVSASTKSLDVITGDFSWLKYKRSPILLEEISAAVTRGVKVRVIGRISELHDRVNGESLDKLKGAGVEILEVPPTYEKNHVKVIVCDDKYTLTITPISSTVISSDRTDGVYIGQFVESKEIAFFNKMVFELLMSASKKLKRT
jgi:sugar-specific transcriptional regulator TrmB